MALYFKFSHREHALKPTSKHATATLFLDKKLTFRIKNVLVEHALETKNLSEGYIPHSKHVIIIIIFYMKSGIL